MVCETKWWGPNSQTLVTKEAKKVVWKTCFFIREAQCSTTEFIMIIPELISISSHVRPGYYSIPYNNQPVPLITLFQLSETFNRDADKERLISTSWRVFRVPTVQSQHPAGPVFLGFVCCWMNQVDTGRGGGLSINIWHELRHLQVFIRKFQHGPFEDVFFLLNMGIFQCYVCKGMFFWIPF